jgi:catechol 2,3-dioxygenase-like lactoylglutathione lyase family enzyme
MVSVYAVDLETSYDFYTRILGFTNVTPMGPNAWYFRFGQAADGSPFGMYLIGAHRPPQPPSEKIAHATFCFDVEHVQEWFDHLVAQHVNMIMSEPMDMGSGYYWFSVLDPNGIAIEFVGQR